MLLGESRQLIMGESLKKDMGVEGDEGGEHDEWKCKEGTECMKCGVDAGKLNW